MYFLNIHSSNLIVEYLFYLIYLFFLCVSNQVFHVFQIYATLNIL